MDPLLAIFLDKISQNLSLFLVVETRMSATLMVVFFLRREWVPAKIIIGLSLILSFFLIQSNGIASHVYLETLPLLLYALVSQLLLGVISGLILNFFAEFFIGFGQVISMQAGLGFVNLYVPRIGSITPLSHFFLLLSIIIFFHLNAHLVLINMIISSFNIMPSLPAINGELLYKLIEFSGILFKGIVMLSLAVLFSIMLSNITLALVTKFAPQLNLFSIGINISLLLCFLILYLSFDVLVENGSILCNELMTFIQKLLQ